VSGRLYPPGTRAARLTPAQYRILRYWAGCTADQADTWIATHGPAPRCSDYQAQVLHRSRLARPLRAASSEPWTIIPTDAGYIALKMRPAGRDRRCPWCHAAAWTRCVVDGVHVDGIHDVRATPPHPPAAPARTMLAAITGAYDPEAPVGLITAT
jgi:hypothetical protein